MSNDHSLSQDLKEKYAALRKLADGKAREWAACENLGGHFYQQDGPLSDFAPAINSYVCSICGIRTTVEEGQRYMARKPSVFD